MRSVSPRIAGADEFDIAEDQHEFKPVRACLVPMIHFDAHGHPFEAVVRVIRYTLTPDERARIATGEDLYFGTPADQLLQPHWLNVGFV